MRNLRSIYKNKINKTEISLVGIGMGSSNSFSLEAINTCLEADLLIGAGRMLEAVEKLREELLDEEDSKEETSKKAPWDSLEEYRPQEIANYIRNHPEYHNVAVVLSGDVGFYSGAKKLKTALEEDEILSQRGIEISLLPGISSVVYFAAKLGVSWEDAAFASIHGREDNVVGIVRDHEKNFVLAGGSEGIKKLLDKLTYYNFENLKIYLGLDFSYDSEEIIELTKKEESGFLKVMKKTSLALLYIQNPHRGNAPLTAGIPDGAFLRGKVPMTKEEVRSVSLSKMHLKKDSIVYDIGAGTGSISLEAAILASKGKVYAVECNPDAVNLIKENAKKFQVDNLAVTEGMAPEAMENLPAPDIVFIGGSKGHLKEILQVVKKKTTKARIVINAITLETLTEALKCCKEFPVTDDEIIELSVSKSSSIGNYHMMKAHNPIYIISFTLLALETEVEEGKEGK